MNINFTAIAFYAWLFFLSKYCGANDNLAFTIGLFPNVLAILAQWWRHLTE